MNKINLKALFQTLPSIEKYGSIYYRINYLYDLLNLFSEEQIDLVDLTIVPFYLIDEITYELYDFEFNIRFVEKPNINDFFLLKTGKKNIKEINEDVLDKLKNCYYEITAQNISGFIDSISHYYKYLIRSEIVKKRIEDNIGVYSINNMYFEVY